MGVGLRIPERNEAGEEAAHPSRRYSCLLLLRIIVFSKENRSGGCYY